MATSPTTGALTRMVEGRIVPAAGHWEIDPGHTSAAFAIRHLLTRMRGRFTDLSGSIIIDEVPAKSTVEVAIQAASLSTGNNAADDALRGERFLDVEHHQTITFASTEVVASEDGRWTIVGDLTIKGVTRSVSLATSFLGAATSPLGDLRKMSFDATTRITRDQFEMGWLMESPDTPGVYIMGNELDITLDIEADLQA